MKTLVLLSALVLLAFQVQADPIQQTDEETKTEGQTGEEDQDVSISFGDPDGSVLQFLGSRPPLECYCRESCRRKEYVTAFCRPGHNKRYYFCCS